MRCWSRCSGPWTRLERDETSNSKACLRSLYMENTWSIMTCAPASDDDITCNVSSVARPGHCNLAVAMLRRNFLCRLSAICAKRRSDMHGECVASYMFGTCRARVCVCVCVCVYMWYCYSDQRLGIPVYKFKTSIFNRRGCRTGAPAGLGNCHWRNDQLL
jgi:hypothetical protein